MTRDPLVRRLARGGVATTIVRLVNALLSIVVTAVLARQLSPSDFGAYLLAFTVVTFLSSVAVLGTDQTSVRRIAGSGGLSLPLTASEVVRATRSITLLGTLIVSLSLLAVERRLFGDVLKSPQLIGSGWLVCAWVAFQATNQAQAAALRGLHAHGWSSALSGMIRTIFFLGIVAVLAYLQRMELRVVLAGGVLSSSCSWAIGLLALRAHGVGGADANSRGSLFGTIASMIRESWPLLVTTSVGLLITQSDLWFVGFYGTTDELALYGAVTRVMFVVTLPLLVLNTTLSSTIAQLYYQGDHEELESILRSSAAIASLVTGLIVVALFAFGGTILGILFGDFYKQGQLILSVLAVGRLASVATGACGTALVMTGRQSLQLLLSIGTVLSLISLSVWAGARHGAIGVAVAFSFVMFLSNAITLAVTRSQLGIWTHLRFSWPGTASWRAL